VFILPQLSKYQPSETVDEELSTPSTVVLADPEFGQPGSIDLLLGAEVYSRLIRPDFSIWGRISQLYMKPLLGGLCSAQ